MYDIELERVRKEDREILANLLEKHLYEFSQWDLKEVNPLGLYGYQYLDYYFTEENRWAYFIKVEGQLAGFVMVITLPEVHDRETDYQMAEFFVLHKYRRKGLGYEAFRRVTDTHRGKWQLKLHPGNIPSVHFWEKSISRLTEGDYELVKAYPGTEYEDGTPGDVYFFES